MNSFQMDNFRTCVYSLYEMTQMDAVKFNKVLDYRYLTAQQVGLEEFHAELKNEVEAYPSFHHNSVSILPYFNFL